MLREKAALCQPALHQESRLNALHIISLATIGIVALANIRVSTLVIRCPMFSSFQKLAQCAIVWFVPLLGAVGIWAFVRSQYNWAKYDTHAFPEHSEKMVLVELDTAGHGAPVSMGETHGD